MVFIHSTTWVAHPLGRHYNQYMPGWKKDNFSLLYALGIPGHAIIEAHRNTKHDIIFYANDVVRDDLDQNYFTIIQ